VSGHGAKHHIADGRHIDACGEQIDGDGNVGVALVFVLTDELFTLSLCPVIYALPPRCNRPDKGLKTHHPADA